MNSNGRGKKLSWHNLKYYPDTCLEGPRKTTRNVSQDTQSPGRNLNPGPPQNEAGFLTIQLRHSVF
jgi:hypothetical protein